MKNDKMVSLFFSPPWKAGAAKKQAKLNDDYDEEKMQRQKSVLSPKEEDNVFVLQDHAKESYVLKTVDDQDRL